jgi:hypothetical protein
VELSGGNHALTNPPENLHNLPVINFTPVINSTLTPNVCLAFKSSFYIRFNHHNFSVCLSSFDFTLSCMHS